MTNPICVVGTVATDPKYLARKDDRVSFCSFRIASNERRYDREKGGWVNGDTTWLTVNAFRSLADHAHESFSKGDRVVVSGRLKVRRWEWEGKSGTAVEIEAEALGHDLRWGVSKFDKRIRGDSAASGAASRPGDVEEDRGSAVEGTPQSAWEGVTTGAEAASEASSDGFLPQAA